MPNEEFFNQKFDQLIGSVEEEKKVVEQSVGSLSEKIAQSGQGGGQMNQLVDRPDITLADVLRNEFEQLREVLSESGGDGGGAPSQAGGGFVGAGVGGGLGGGLGVGVGGGLSIGSILSKALTGASIGASAFAGLKLGEWIRGKLEEFDILGESNLNIINDLIVRPFKKIASGASFSEAFSGIELTPQAKRALKNMKAFFNKQLPQFFGFTDLTSGLDAMKQFLTVTLPNLFTVRNMKRGLKEVKQFFTTTLPNLFTVQNLKKGARKVSTFFTKTLPNFFTNFSQNLSNKTVKKWIKPISDFFTKTIPNFFTLKRLKGWLSSYIKFWTVTLPKFFTGKTLKQWMKPVKNFFVKDIPNFFSNMLNKAKKKITGFIPSASSLNPFSGGESEEESGSGVSQASDGGSQQSSSTFGFGYFDTPSVMKAEQGTNVSFAPGDFFASAQDPSDLLRQVVQFTGGSGGQQAGGSGGSSGTSSGGFSGLSTKLQKMIDLLSAMKDALESEGGDVVKVPSEEPSRDSFNLASKGV